MKHNEQNERIKRAYRLHLKAARGLSDASIDVASAAIHRFEECSAFRPFKKFHFEQAIAFRRRLDEARNERTGNPIKQGHRAASLEFIARVLPLAGGTARLPEPNTVFRRRLFSALRKGHARCKGDQSPAGADAGAD